MRTGNIPFPTTGEVSEAEVAEAAKALTSPDASDSSGPAAAVPEIFDEAFDEPEQKRGKGALIALALLMLIGGGAVIAMSPSAKKTASSSEQIGGSVTAPATPPQTTATPNDASTGGAAKVAPSEPGKKANTKPELSVVVSAVQQDATIALDGKPQGKGSVTFNVPDDGVEHTLTISAEGFKPHTQTFTGAFTLKDIKLEADTTPSPSTGRASSRRGSSRRGSPRRSTTLRTETRSAETKPTKADPWKIKSSDLEDPWRKR